MLRTNNTAHFAFQHSPEKEQRLLFAVTDPNDPNNPIEKPDEGKDGGGETPVEKNPVDLVRSSTADLIAENSPEVILQELTSRQRILELLLASGALSEKVDATIKELGMSDPEKDSVDMKDIEKLEALEPEQRKAFVELFLEKCNEKEIIRIIEAANSGLSRYEGYMRDVENKLKPLIRKTRDPGALEKVMRNISWHDLPTEDDVMTWETGSAERITPQNVIEKAGLTGSYTFDERQSIYEALADISRAISIKKSFGQPTDKIVLSTEDGRQKNKTEFVTDVGNNTEVLLRYLDVKINARAAKLMSPIAEASIAYDGETRKTGITADGVDDALGGNIGTLKWIRRELTSNVRPGIHDHKKGLTGAKEALGHLERIEKEVRNDKQRNEPRALVEKEIMEQDRVVWAKETAERLQKMNLAEIESKSPKAAQMIASYMVFFQAFMEGETQTEEDIIGICQTKADEMVRIRDIIRMIEINPKAFTEEALQEIYERIPEDKLEAMVTDIRAELKKVIPGVLGTIDHPAARFLKIDKAVGNLQKEIQGNLLHVESVYERKKNGENLPSGVLEHVQGIAGRVFRKMERLKQCEHMLLRIANKDSSVIVPLNREEYKELVGRDSFGSYEYGEGKMYLNTERIKENGMDESDVIEHEMGHAIVDTFRRSGVFPTIMLSFYENLKNERADTGESLETILIRQAPVWGIEVANPASPTMEENWKMMDELANRYSLWKEEGETGRITSQERALFNVCRDPNRASTPPEAIELTGFAHLDGDDTDTGTSGVGSEAPAAMNEEKVVYEENLLEFAVKKVIYTDAFLKAYPELETFLEANYEYGDLKSRVKNAQRAFKDGTYFKNRDEFIRVLTAVKTVLELIEKNVVKKIDLAKTDLTHETKTGTRSLWRVVCEDPNWVSISDIMVMFKDAGEDIARMWKRRGEAARNRLGKDITSLINDKIPYLGRLKHEFERRDRTSEEEEVGVWEKGLEKIDPHDLLHSVPSVRSRDHLRAIINLVTKKGRMDWDDEHLWDKLEYYSGYRMPRTACRRDSDLRNQWLQKMAADIWRNKDVFEHWKAENDSATDSGRKHLDPYVEELSATGKLRKELRRLLENFTRMNHGEILSKEEEVNPHLYEGIVYYAMRNGKMSMEEKFFYLVKGVDEGLLSVDRLRAFSGENFGILNSFPFIDYFSSGQNCSKHEIKKIAGKITEDSSVGGDPFAPGARMTRFLMQEVAFDKNVHDRVEKALKRGENIDHEDIPLYITHVDYVGVSTLVNFTSGSQWKLSPPALKNGYVGYNTFFKYFGIKAKMGHPPITNRDVDKIVGTLGGYARWDNTITRHSLGGASTDQRPFLGWNQINNEAPVSGDRKTKAYRDSMNDFTLELCQRLRINEVDGFKITDYIGKDRDSNTIERIKKDYGGDANKAYEKIQGASPKFVESLKQALSTPAGVDVLTQLLKEKEGGFLVEGHQDDFNYQKVRGFWDNGDSDDEDHAAHGGHAH